MGARENLTATESILTLDRNSSLSKYMVDGLSKNTKVMENAFPIEVHLYSLLVNREKCLEADLKVW